MYMDLRGDEVIVLINVLKDALSVYDEYSIDSEESDLAYYLVRELYTLDNLTISSNNV